MQVIFLTLFFISVIYVQTKGLIKNKEWKELFVYSLMMLIGMTYSYGIIFDLPLPNPILTLSNLFKPIYDYLYNQLLV